MDEDNEYFLDEGYRELTELNPKQIGLIIQKVFWVIRLSLKDEQPPSKFLPDIGVYLAEYYNKLDIAGRPWSEKGIASFAYELDLLDCHGTQVEEYVHSSGLWHSKYGSCVFGANDQAYLNNAKSNIKDIVDAWGLFASKLIHYKEENNNGT